MCMSTFWSQFLYLRGHCGLQTASEVKSDLGFEISDLNYPHIHVHLTLLIPVFISSRPLWPPNGLGGHTWHQIWNQWPKEPLGPKFQTTFVSHFWNLSREREKKKKSTCSWPAGNNSDNVITVTRYKAHFEPGFLTKTVTIYYICHKAIIPKESDIYSKQRSRHDRFNRICR